MTIRRSIDAMDPGRRTAVLIVAGEDSAPDRAFDMIQRLFGDYFDQIVFLTIGLVDYPVIDAPDFKASDVGRYVRHTARGSVTTCVDQARRAGMAAVTCIAVGTDPVDEVEKLSVGFAQRCPTAMFFLGKVVFQEQKWYHPLLHGRTAESIQRRLERHGLPVAILPIVVPS
ncbi:MAG TPA: hypothetical protein VKW04_21775 [Planctomycetota bacterium]|nr:hypothetical protein [Planctomycetota bacterium]